MVQAEPERLVTEFFQQFPSISWMLKAILVDEPLLVMEFQPSGTTLALDFSADPVQVSLDPVGVHATVTMVASAGTFRDLVLGTQAAAELLGDRQLLLKGGMYSMTKMMPMLRLSAPLFADYLITLEQTSRAGEPGLRRRLSGGSRRLAAGLSERPWRVAAFAAGLGLGQLERDELLEALAAMAGGLERMSPLLVEKKPPLPRAAPRHHPLSTSPPSRRRTAALKVVGGSMFAVGVAVGVTRYKMRVPIRPMRILGRMSDGIQRSREWS